MLNRRYEIELYVPLNGWIRGPECGNEPQPVARLASTTVTVQLGPCTLEHRVRVDVADAVLASQTSNSSES